LVDRCSGSAVEHRSKRPDPNSFPPALEEFFQPCLKLEFDGLLAIRFAFFSILHVPYWIESYPQHPSGKVKSIFVFPIRREYA
jgi:hypothetical protein